MKDGKQEIPENYYLYTRTLNETALEKKTQKRRSNDHDAASVCSERAVDLLILFQQSENGQGVECKYEYSIKKK